MTRAGATGVKLLRADSGFWNTKVFKRLEKAGWQYSIGVRMIKTVRAAVEAIDEDAWTTIATTPTRARRRSPRRRYGGRRLIVRRTRLLGAQAELWPDWRHFCFLTNRSEEIALVEAEHRDHAVVEQVIADLKDQALAHFPSGQFNANAAWTVLAVLAHNLLRWTQLLGLPDTTVRAARTLRRWLLSVPGRLTRHARGWTLHLPARWPWHSDYTRALDRIRALPAAPPDSRRTATQQTSRPLVRPGTNRAGHEHLQTPPPQRHHARQPPIAHTYQSEHRPQGRRHRLTPTPTAPNR